jgi:chromosome partitioning protein
MTTVLATYNVKGGVGKTSAAVNLARLAAEDGARTLIWDLDPQGASTYLFRVKPKVKGGGKALVKGKSDVDALLKGTDHEGLDLLPADFSYRHMDLALDGTKQPTARLKAVLAPLEDDYDYTFLDCPPSVSLVSESVFEAADVLLVPIIPATLSSRTFAQIEQLLTHEGGPRVMAFFSMVDPRKRLHRDVMKQLRDEQPAAVLDTAIPMAADIERMGARRSPIADFAPRSTGARAYRELWDEICAKMRNTAQ